MAQLPEVSEDFANFSVRTEKRRSLPHFNASFGTYKLNITNTEYWKSTKPLDVVSNILQQFLELVVTKDNINDVFRIVIEGTGEDSITPLSTRFLRGYSHSSESILQRFEYLLQSHDALQFGDPITIHVTRVHSLDYPTQQLAHHVHNVETSNKAQ